jgi:Fur family peroxide stress response transcriptional regulator
MNYKNILNALQLKATPQRLKLIALLEERGHMTLEAIYQSLKIDSPMLSLSTVYNNLATLTKKCVVREVAVSGANQVYELVKNDHAHLICKECGNIMDIEIDYSAIKAMMKLPKGALLEEGDLIFFGICPKCSIRIIENAQIINATI